MASTIFERCGGFASVRRIVSAFYDRVLGSPQLGRYFERVDMATLIDHQTKFVSFVMGGPASVFDQTLERVHAPLKISRAEFDECLRLLREALEEFQIDGADIARIETELKRREPLIVHGG